MVLEQAGHAMTEAPHGDAALNQLNDELPDLMLVDSKMPILDGAGLIARMRANPAHRSVPIILMTGFSDRHPLADAVVPKPFDKQQLLDEIDRLVSRARPAS